MEKLSSEQSETSDRVLEFDLSAELRHGIAVSNLAYALSKELGLPHEQCYDLAIAGMLHDIGKLKLRSYINGQESNPMVIEELKYVRMHSTLGYEELKDQGYSDFVLESILYHHENYDRCTKDRSHGTDIQLQRCKSHSGNQVTHHTENCTAQECSRNDYKWSGCAEASFHQKWDCNSNERNRSCKSSYSC